MDNIEMIQRTTAFIIKITSPLIILMLVTSSLWYASCHDTAQSFLCGPYNNDRLERVSHNFVIVSMTLCFFPCFLFLFSTCCIMTISSQNIQGNQEP